MVLRDSHCLSLWLGIHERRLLVGLHIELFNRPNDEYLVIKPVVKDEH